MDGVLYPFQRDVKYYCDTEIIDIRLDLSIELSWKKQCRILSQTNGTSLHSFVSIENRRVLIVSIFKKNFEWK